MKYVCMPLKQTHFINHQFSIVMKTVSFIVYLVSAVIKIMLAKPEATNIWIIIESMFVRKVVCNGI